VLTEVANVYNKIGESRMASIARSIASDVEVVRLEPVTEFEVFMTSDATRVDARRIGKTLRHSDEVLSWEYLSQAEALKEFAKEYPQFAKRLPSDALPASFRITNEPGSFERLSPTLASAPGVDEINTPSQILDGINRSQIRELFGFACPEPDFSEVLQLPPRRLR
jgi:cell division protein FtsX